MLAHARAQSDPLQQLITYDQPAQTVKQLLADLSKQTGVRLFAPSPIDAEIVLVSVKQMPLKELMNHLAYVTDGEWFQQKDGSYHLVRSPKLARERREQDNEQILKGLQRALEQKEVRQLAEPLTEQQVRASRDKIKELMREIEASDLSEPLWRTPQGKALSKEFDSLTTGGRLVLRLLQKMGLRRLLEIPVGERRVFSNVRGRFLLPFGFSVEALVQQYVGEQRLLYELWTHPTEGISFEKADQFWQRYGQSLFISDWARDVSPTQLPEKIYLEVERNDVDSFRFNVIIEVPERDRGSRIVWGGYWDLSASSDQEEVSASSKSESQTSPPPTEHVEWSERSRQFIEAFRAMMQTSEPIPLPEIFDPAQVEPLSLIPADILRTYARKKGQSVIALLSDRVSFGFYFAPILGINELNLLHKELISNCEVEQKSSTMLIKPRYFSYLWGERISRQAVSQLIKQVMKRGYWEAEDILTLRRSHTGKIELFMIWTLFYLWLITEGDFPLLRDIPRFLLRFTPQQWDQLLSGKPLRLSDLTKAQRELIEQDIYLDNYNFDIFLDEFYSHPLIHAFYPNGLPTETTIELQNANPALGLFTHRKLGVWCEIRNVEMSLSILRLSESRDGNIRDDVLDRLSEQIGQDPSQPLMPVLMRPIRLSIRTEEGRSFVLSEHRTRMFDIELLNDGKPAMLNDLPQEIRNTLQELIERLQKRKSDGN
jgi:hypothetical protein